MSRLFSPSVSAPPPLPATPTPPPPPPMLNSAQGQQAAAAAALRARGAAGYSSTIGTSPTGLAAPASTTNKTLLGG